MKTPAHTEAMKIYVLREKGEGYSWRVEPPEALKVIEEKLPFYGKRGFWLKNWDELRSWIEEVSRRKILKQKEEEILKSGVSDREYTCDECNKLVWVRCNEDGIWVCENCGAEVLWGLETLGKWRK